MFGVSDLSDIQSIQEILGAIPEVHQALILEVGQGQFQTGNDIDIAIKGDEATIALLPK